jgi:cytochrome c5
MKPLLALFVTVHMLAACTRKSVPVITTREAPSFKPDISIYAEPGTVTADTLQGKSVFMARCERCHGIPDPLVYTVSQWEDILERMIPRARIGKENAVHVRGYILSKVKRL